MPKNPFILPQIGLSAFLVVIKPAVIWKICQSDAQLYLPSTVLDLYQNSKYRIFFRHLDFYFMAPICLGHKVACPCPCAFISQQYNFQRCEDVFVTKTMIPFTFGRNLIALLLSLQRRSWIKIVSTAKRCSQNSPTKRFPYPYPIHPSTYSSKARKTHDVIYF